MSATLDLPDADWTLVTLSGTWARERHRRRAGARAGTAGRRQPARRLRRRAQPVPRAPPRGHDRGRRRGAGASRSPGRGNFLAEADVDAARTPRGCGSGSTRRPSPGRSSPATRSRRPRPLLAWSGDGLGGMSDALHAAAPRAAGPRAVARPSAPGPAQQLGGHLLRLRPRPARRHGRARRRRWASSCSCSTTAGSAAATATTASLGDWIVDRRKLPHGLDGLAREVKALGLGFGLWIEPEMVNPDRDLFRAHPDWAIGVPGRRRTESRQQLVLDFAQPGGRGPPRRRHRRGARERARSTTSSGTGTASSPSPGPHRCPPTARASSSTATSWACTTCTSG